MEFIFTVLFVSALFISGKASVVQSSQTSSGEPPDPISLSINKLTEAIERNRCTENSWSSLINRLIRDVETSVVSSRKLSEQISDLQQKVTRLADDLDTAKLGRGQEQLTKNSVYFSAATAKRVHCYDCPIKFEIVYACSHDNALHDGVFTAPLPGFYLFQFHGLVEAGKMAKLQMVFNGAPVLFMYDRDIDSNNNRYSMIGQSIIHKMDIGDTMMVRLHEGALKGGGTHPFTSLVGMLVGNNHETSRPIFPRHAQGDV